MSCHTSNGTQPCSPEQQSIQSGNSEVSSVVSHAQRPLLRHSSTYEEKTNRDDDSSASSVDTFTQSDTAQLAGWKSSRRINPQVPQSVPNKPKYKFSQEDFAGSSLYSRPGTGRSFPKPFSRAGTVPVGLGSAMQRAPECTICLEEYMEDGLKAPLLLTCGHSFCTGCLETLLLKASASNPAIACPKCNNLTQVKNRDITNLRKNFDLLDAIRTISESLSSGSSSSYEPPKNESREVSPVDIKCDEHGDNLSSYCKKCGVLVCSSCLLFGLHSSHNDKTLFTGQAAKEYRKKFREISPEVWQQKKKMEGVLVEVERMNVSVQETGGRLVEETETEYNNLIRQIEAKRDALKLEIMERTQIRVEALTDQACDLQECIEKATAVYHTTEGLLRSNDYTLLQRANLTLDEIEGVFVNPPSGIPKAQNDLRCEFPEGPKEEIESYLSGYGSVRPDVGTIKHLYVKPYHDGFRIQWDGHNFADNEGTTYYLQKAVGGDGEFSKLSRGNATKFNYKEELEHGVPYRFRVQVRTTEGVGNWSEPKEAMKAAPDFRWHDLWRNVKIDLSRDKLEAAWTKGGSHNFWATFAGDKPLQRGKQHYTEIKILDLGKGKSPKKLKLAFGVVSCSKSRAGSMPWQDGKLPIGQWEIPSWAFQPTAGVINSQDTPPEGVKYGADVDLQNDDNLGMLVDLDEKKVIYFVNGRELGVAFDDIDAESVLPVVSIRDKIRVRLCFPPPPYNKRSIKFIKLSSRGHSICM